MTSTSARPGGGRSEWWSLCVGRSISGRLPRSTRPPREMATSGNDSRIEGSMCVLVKDCIVRSTKETVLTSITLDKQGREGGSFKSAGAVRFERPIQSDHHFDRPPPGRAEVGSRENPRYSERLLSILRSYRYNLGTSPNTATLNTSDR